MTSLLDSNVLGSGYHVYMGSFYTSPKLLTYLFAMKFGACGTYRDCRKGCPWNTANSLTKRSSRGFIRWIQDGPPSMLPIQETLCRGGESSRYTEDKDFSMYWKSQNMGWR